MPGREATCGASSSADTANQRPKDGHRLPAELLHEIVQVLPIAKCFHNVSTYLSTTELRPFIRRRFELGLKTFNANTERIVCIANLHNKITDQYMQLVTLFNQRPVNWEQIAARKQEMRGKIDGWNAEIGALKKQVNQFKKAWECSRNRQGRIGGSDNGQQNGAERRRKRAFVETNDGNKPDENKRAKQEVADKIS